MQRYYFDFAATTPLLPEVKAEMHRVMDIYGNPSSIHHHGRLAKTIVEDARKETAQLLNCSLGEIFFSSGATESNNTTLLRACTDLGVTRIVSSPIEHHCITHTLDYLNKQKNIDVHLLSVDSKGNIDLNELAQVLNQTDVKTLVSLMHGNNEIGTVLPLDKVSQIVKSNKAFLNIDAAQTFGKLNIDLEETPVDFLAASAHKLYGPKGIGLMYISEDISISPLFFGGAQERNMRSGTENIIGIAGFAQAVKLSRTAIEERHNIIQELRDYFLDKLGKAIPNLSINGNEKKLFLSNIISLNLPKNNKTDLLVFNLDIKGISASAGSACSSGVEQASHVLATINPDNLDNSLRISLSHLTTKPELDYLIETLVELCA